VRRLQELIERNYIERRGRFYHVGDGAFNPENIQMAVERTTAITSEQQKNCPKWTHKVDLHLEGVYENLPCVGSIRITKRGSSAIAKPEELNSRPR